MSDRTPTPTEAAVEALLRAVALGVADEAWGDCETPCEACMGQFCTPVLLTRAYNTLGPSPLARLRSEWLAELQQGGEVTGDHLATLAILREDKDYIDDRPKFALDALLRSHAALRARVKKYEDRCSSKGAIACATDDCDRSEWLAELQQGGEVTGDQLLELRAAASLFRTDGTTFTADALDALLRSHAALRAQVEQLKQSLENEKTPWISCDKCGYAGRTDPLYENSCVACWVMRQRNEEVTALRVRCEQLQADSGLLDRIAMLSDELWKTSLKNGDHGAAAAYAIVKQTIDSARTPGGRDGD